MKKANLIIFSLLPFFCLSQNSITLKGSVSDIATPLPWVNVVLFSPEGKYISGTTTKENGSFELTVQKGKYKIIVSAVGFSNWEKLITLEVNVEMKQIHLERNAADPGEVIIKSERKIIEQKIDRLIYNAEKNIALAGSDALYALATAPGVIVQNNSISILGKGSCRVMIDGRMIELSGEELNNYLKSIAASDIRNIEIISNPPAGYDAGGDGGLINIILKKGIRNSWKNSTTLSYDQNRYQSFTLRNNFIYNKNKMRFSASANGKLGNSYGKEYLDIYYPDGLWQLRTASRIKENSLSGRIAIDYDITSKTTAGIQYSGEIADPGFNFMNTAKIHNSSNLPVYLLLNNGLNRQHTGITAWNAHILSKSDSLKRNISFDIDCFTYHSKFDNVFNTNKFLPDLTFLNTEQSARNISNQHIENISVKTDIEHTFKLLSLSYGIKASFVKSKSDIQYYNTISGIPVIDPTQSNSFNYRENTQAIFINSAKTFKGKLSIQAGLRLEYTQTTGYQETTGQQTKNDYSKLFPTVYISYQKNTATNFNFTYGKRINRPGFRLLNPFRSYINSNSYSEGNPFLRASFSDNFEFSYSGNTKFRTTAFFTITSGGYGVIFTSNPLSNTQIVTRENYYKEYYYGIGENYTVKITKRWESRVLLYLMGAKTNFTSSINAVPSNSTQLYFSASNSFSLGESTKLQADFFYSSPFKRGLYKVGYMSGLNLALKQDLLKKKLQLTLLINDAFNTAYLKNYASIVNGINQVYSQNNSSRYFQLSITHQIGNKKILVQPRDFGNEEEKGRTDNNQ